MDGLNIKILSQDPDYHFFLFGHGKRGTAPLDTRRKNIVVLVKYGINSGYVYDLQDVR